MRTRVFSLFFAVLAVVSVATGADARPVRNAQSLDQILPQIREQHPGTFYDADGPFTGADGQAHYRIKWKTPEGRVVWFDADARTGHVTNADGGGRDNSVFDDRRGNRDSDRNQSSNGRRNRFGDDGEGEVLGNPYSNEDRPRRDRDGDWSRRNDDRPRGRDWNDGQRGNDQRGNDRGRWNDGQRGGGNDRGNREDRGNHGGDRGNFFGSGGDGGGRHRQHDN